MHHPRLANVFLLAFALWPCLLIVCKAKFPALCWRWLWLTVPVVSWITVNAAVRLDYPTQGGLGGLGLLVSQVTGWFDMLPVFGFFQLGFLFWQRHRRKPRRPV